MHLHETARRVYRVLVLGAIIITGAAHAAGTALTVTVNDDDIVISHLLPGGTATLFSCTRGTRQGRNHVTHEAVIVRDEDGDGTIRFVPDIPILFRSVWVAVDDTSSATAVGAPAGFPLYITENLVARFKKDSSGDIVQMEQDIHRLIVLFVRPKNGAWLIAARDGAEADTDGTVNGKLSVEFGAARPVGDGKENAPKKLKADDVVVGIDPNTLDVFVMRMTR